MARQELIEYIKSGIEKGYTATSLKSILTSHGWNAGEVDEAISIVEGNNQSLKEVSSSLLPVDSFEKRKPILLKIICISGFVLCLFGIILGIMFLFPNSFNYLFGIFPSLSSYVSVPVSESIFSLANISYIFAIVVNLVAFIGFMLLFKMEKAGMFLIIITGLANIVNSFINFNMPKMFNIIIWALIVLYAVLSRKNYS